MLKHLTYTYEGRCLKNLYKGGLVNGIFGLHAD